MCGAYGSRTAAADPDRPTRVVYVSPIKALAYDVERNLRAPLAGLVRMGAAAGITVDVRTGDTPTKERERQRKSPGQILITTPESLYLLLAGQQRERLLGVDTVIVDEIHALAPTKRGIHLALTLEREQPPATAVAPRSPALIFLSATRLAYAAAIASSVSAVPRSGTSAITSCVAGL